MILVPQETIFYVDNTQLCIGNYVENAFFYYIYETIMDTSFFHKMYFNRITYF